jgi:hypothetical protein
MSSDPTAANRQIDPTLRSPEGRRTLQISLPLVILVGISAFFISMASILLIRDDRSVRASLLALTEIPQYAVVHPIAATDLEQEVASIDYPDEAKKTILFIMSPTCPVCDENWPHWEHIVERLDPNRAKAVVLDISKAKTAKLSELHDLHRLPLFTNISAESILEYRLRATPQTIVVRAAGRRIGRQSAGRIDGVWTGLLSSSNVKEILAAVGQ